MRVQIMPIGHVKGCMPRHCAVREHAWSAGVTIGLMAGESCEGMEQWELIADTSSLEEDLGPMQLHAAGTADGFTALQLVCNRPGTIPSPGGLAPGHTGLRCSHPCWSRKGTLQ